jgi:uracil-DNA glycosylase family 4
MGNNLDVMDEAASTLDWWRMAGVDTLVEDMPRDWFAPALRVPPAVAFPAIQAPPAPSAMIPPADLAALHRTLATLPVQGAGDERLMPEGTPAAGLMLLFDMPEVEDALEGRLITGATGRLLDAMLGAIGRDRESIYLATILPARPAGGRLDPAATADAVRLAAQHVALARPRAVLLCGDGATQALLGMPMPAARNRIHHLNHGGAIIPAVATFHPCRLLDQPMHKAGAWADLRLLLGELA